MKRISQYYPGSDGTKLAVDLYMPECEEKVPVVFVTGREQRRIVAERFGEFIELLVDNHYAVAVTEPRGVGASYGWNIGFHTPIDGRDVAALMDTIALEDWCTGDVGSFGGSNLGNIQELTAIQRPKHLRCIIPCDCNTNMYYQNYPNGASAMPEGLAAGGWEEPMADHVDEDVDGRMALEARQEHSKNKPFLYEYLPNARRDSVNPSIGYAPCLKNPIWSYMDEVRYSDLKVYQNAAWYDPGSTGSLITYKYWGGKVLMGPWDHTEIYRLVPGQLPNDHFDWKGAHLKFFDSVLKHKDPENFADEPDIVYYTRNAKPGEEWRYAPDWPVDNQRLVNLQLTADGAMQTEAAPESCVRYKVRDDITLFPGGRLRRKLLDGFTDQQEKCMTFTTQAVPGDLEVTGIPILELTAESTYRDGNFLAVLLDVAPDGTAMHITEGSMRASHARLDLNDAWAGLGLPYHGSREGQDDRLDQGRLHMAFNLEGISYVVKTGHKLRLCVFCGAKDIYQQPEGMPEDVTVTVHTGGKDTSFLRLPVAEPEVFCFRGDMNGRQVSVYPFRRGVWIRRGKVWEKHLCTQAYPASDGMHYVTEDFTLVKSVEGGEAKALIAGGDYAFCATEPMPRLWCWPGGDRELRPYRPSWMYHIPKPVPNPTFVNQYVASVPVRKGRRDVMNTECYATKDLLVDIALPECGAAPYPCIVNFHGFGESNHDFLGLARHLLAKGYAVASIQYRTCPPNVWPYSGMDAKGCIRFLKAHASQYQLDPERFGFMGGSMGGHMSSMLAADNGRPELEGDIGGNTEFTSSAKAAVIYYPWTNFFTFANQCADLYPGKPERAGNADAPFSPMGAMVGYNAAGEGAGALKKHINDEHPDPFFEQLLQLAHDASPVEHVHWGSMPCAIIHGMEEKCLIQIPLGQSIEYFRRLTECGVHAQLYANNTHFFGDEPEIIRAAVEFLTSRV